MSEAQKRNRFDIINTFERLGWDIENKQRYEENFTLIERYNAKFAKAPAKHLSAVLAHIKEEQDKAAPPPKVKPVSAKNGYQKTGRRPPGRPSKMEAYYERRRKERATEASEAVND